ncbi:hypothetical protein [Bradyrhizobium sp.]|jgi:hypothetical protein|uniref:hypothetical protein n=1 Tax=Bradyrhizobium sp. TaxID=376 RepID=UPI002E0CF863|nr:hypothetical protein [Bradyrhizobium sp.]
MDSSEKTDEPQDPGKLPMYLSPYEAWNFGPGKGYAFPAIRKFSKHISAVAEVRPSPAARGRVYEIVSAKGKLPTLWKDPALTFVPFVVENPFGRAIKGPEELKNLLLDALTQVRPQFEAAEALLQSVQPPPEAKFVDISNPRFRVAFPIPDRAMNEKLNDGSGPPDWECDDGLQARIGANKRITIMAVIDDGLPFAHRNFRDASGCRTRIEFCWLQSVAIDEKQKSVLFGREYTRKQIDGYIKKYGDDEDTLYREAGATADAEDLGSMIARHATHGAHIMDLATGYAAERGDIAPEEIRIVAVQLPNTIALDTSGFGKDMYMLAAFHYIFNRVDLIAEKYGIECPRLVINFSYGFSGGRHDGGTELEAAINQMVERRRASKGPTALVVPAGNSFLSGLHGRLRDTDFDNDEAKFRWRIQPNDRTPCYLELWFPQDFDPSGYVVELYDPWKHCRLYFKIEVGAPKDGYDPGKVVALYNAHGKQVGQVSADQHRADHRNDEHKTGRWRVLVIMAPTEPEDPRLPGVESGEWIVVLKRGVEAARLQDYPIHCWIQRSADPDDLRSGSRQSYFDDPKDVGYGCDGDLNEEDTRDAFVQRFGSLNGLATGCTSLVVAGYRLGAGLGSTLSQARPALYSSAGTLDPGWPEAKVACSSMSDRSRVLTGTIAAGVRSGSLSYVQGTSNAAPFVARRLAAIFVDAENGEVKAAEDDNYRPLLSGYCDPKASRHGPNADDLATARLGIVRVAPHWQPGIEVELLEGNDWEAGPRPDAGPGAGVADCVDRQGNVADNGVRV